MQLLLRSLEPEFIRCDVGVADEYHGRPKEDGEIQWGGFLVDLQTHVDTLAEADGLLFLCPKCFMQNGGSVGTHQVAVYFEGRGAPPHIGVNASGQTTRWKVMGNDVLDLTIDPSIRLISGCCWHGWIQHGVVRNA